jgi:hypothetical protein
VRETDYLLKLYCGDSNLSETLRGAAAQGNMLADHSPTASTYESSADCGVFDDFKNCIDIWLYMKYGILRGS